MTFVKHRHDQMHRGLVPPDQIASGSRSEGDVPIVQADDTVEWGGVTGGVADILDLPTAETDDTLVLAPDGAGGVEFRAETGGADDQTAAEVPFTPAGTIAATDTQTAVEEVATDAASALSTHAGAADPHTGYRLESDNHSHASSGAQGGVVAASAISFSPTGSIAATDVQAAIAEVAAEAGAGTSVATDGIWAAAGDIAVATGNDAAAVLPIGAAGGAVSRVNGAVAWNSGTSNPGAAAAGDRYWRSDLGLEIYFDGTRWLTTTLFTLGLTAPHAGLTVTTGNYLAPRQGWDVWFVDLDVSIYVTTTNDGAKFWGVALQWRNAAGTWTSIGSVDTSASSPNVYAELHDDVDTLVDDGDAVAWQFLVTKTSTPGTVYPAAVATYRLVVP